MCGILFTNDPEVTREDFHLALAAMRHRGPDAAGCYARHGAVQLGHNRLSVVDLDPRSHQPFYSSDGRHVIVFNGEIYNYQELARTHRIDLRTQGDTELLLELFLRKGSDALRELYGMFACVIFDTQTGKYFLARDRLGVKPLYVHERNGFITVASEMSAMVRLVPVLHVDDFAVRQYRQMRGFFNGRTLYREVRMFPAAHWRDDREMNRYWALPQEEQAPPSDEELRDLVVSAVGYRCIADVPVGCYLSGGLDSSIVSALARRTDTWVVGMPKENEFSWASQVAVELGAEHHEVLVEPGQFAKLTLEMIRARGEPLAVPNEVLLYAMTRVVKTKNTVVLSGEGADELFAGYDRIFRWAGAANAWDLAAFAERYCYGSQGDLEVVEDALAPFSSEGSAYGITSAFFQVAHLEGLLRRLDSATMLCGVEGRVPFVDHRLVERLAGVPLSYKMAGGSVKAPLKRVFGSLLPAAVVDRKKVGFPVDLDQALPAGLTGATPMDRWFNFNLAAAGVELESPALRCT